MQRTEFIAAYKVAETESDRKLLIESFIFGQRYYWNRQGYCYQTRQ